MTGFEILQPLSSTTMAGSAPSAIATMECSMSVKHIGRVCHTHKVRWSFGSNLFSGWHKETEEDWERNSKLLSAYENVAPFLYPFDDDDGSDDSNGS